MLSVDAEIVCAYAHMFGDGFERTAEHSWQCRYQHYDVEGNLNVARRQGEVDSTLPLISDCSRIHYQILIIHSTLDRAGRMKIYEQVPWKSDLALE